MLHILGLLLIVSLHQDATRARGLPRSAFRPKTVALLEHTCDVTSLSFSPDGSKLVSGSCDESIAVWDVKTRKRTAATDLREEVKCVRYSTKGDIVAAATNGRGVTLWEGNQLRLHLTPVADGRWSTVALSPDGKIVAAGGDGPAVKIWNSRSGDLMRSLNVDEPDRGLPGIYQILFTLDGSQLVTAGQDGNVTTWSLSDYQKKIIVKTGQAVGTFDFDKKRQLLATAPSQWARGRFTNPPAKDVYDITVWDPSTGDVKATLRGHTDIVSQVQFLPDGKHLASASYDETVRIWEILSGKERCLIDTGGHGWNRCIAIHPDGRMLAFGSADYSIHIVDLFE
jgi:WD40 repeat protein